MRTAPRRRRRSGWIPSGTGPGRLCVQPSIVVQVVSQQVAVRSSRTQAGGLCTAVEAGGEKREGRGGGGRGSDEMPPPSKRSTARSVSVAASPLPPNSVQYVSRQDEAHPSSSSRGQVKLKVALLTDQDAVQSSRAVEHSAGQSVGTVAGGLGCGQFSVVSRPKACTPQSSAAGGAACGADAGASHWPE